MPILAGPVGHADRSRTVPASPESNTGMLTYAWRERSDGPAYSAVTCSGVDGTVQRASVRARSDRRHISCLLLLGAVSLFTTNGGGSSVSIATCLPCVSTGTADRLVSFTEESHPVPSPGG